MNSDPSNWSQEVWDKVHSETIKNLQHTISKIDKDIRKYLDKSKEEWEADCKRELDPRLYLDTFTMYNPYVSGIIGLIEPKKVLGTLSNEALYNSPG
jgi:hypothetical protein